MAHAPPSTRSPAPSAHPVLRSLALFGLTLLASVVVVIGAVWLDITHNIRVADARWPDDSFLLLDGTLALGAAVVLLCLPFRKFLPALSILLGLLPVLALAGWVHSTEGWGPVREYLVVPGRQSAASQPPVPDSLRVYTSAEQYPALPDGGDLPALTDTLATTAQRLLAVPGPQPGDEPITGVVFVSFVVNQRGNISHATLEQGLTPTANTAVLAAVRSLPRLRPGQQQGQPVAVRLQLGVHLTTPRW